MSWRRAGTLAASGLAAVLLTLPATTLPSDSRPAPEFPTRDAARWVGPPQRMAELRGRVVLLDVWTFG